ncbi:methionine synthase II (cobalamin-independent) [Leptolyngbyaceae cyanobacterium JSC-12]|nr:methionine synthase II (cobalamin-independent) [Leptolyngbyaceae cyanobacterium JSC-12]
MAPQTATLGYPRIGKNREVKKALETFWSSESDVETLLQTIRAVELAKQMVQQLKTGVAHLPSEQIWVNPDCGLKTRRWEEVIPALKNIVEAAEILREEVNASQT